MTSTVETWVKTDSSIFQEKFLDSPLEGDMNVNRKIDESVCDLKGNVKDKNKSGEMMFSLEKEKQPQPNMHVEKLKPITIKMKNRIVPDEIGDDIDKVRVECPNCRKSFSTKQSLSTHMKTAKSCIDQKNLKKVFQCNYCNKVLSSKQMLLYHDGICSMKTQHLYEKKLEELQSMIVDGGGKGIQETMMVDESRQFYETNILMRCELMDRFARVPKKRGGLEFDIYPAIVDTIDIPSNTRKIIPLGLKFYVLGGWSAFVNLSCEYRRSDILCIPIILHCGDNDDLNMTICNMTNENIKVVPANAIAEISFYTKLDNYNIHFNCVRSRNGDEDL
jgi:dUTPase